MNDIISISSSDESINILGFKIREKFIESLINKTIRIMVVLILMFVIIKVGNILINKFVKHQVKSNARLSLDAQKAKTLGAVLKSFLRYGTYVFGGLSIIGTISGGFSAGAIGVGGAAIVGLGAQSLIKDIINGVFILFENQYGVGDHVTINDCTGIVENIGIRTTVIRGFDGALYCIQNGTISQVTNNSRGNIRFTIDVEIAYEDNVDKAIEIIERVNKRFEEENEDITEPISILGISSLNPSSVSIRVFGRSKPLKQWKMEAMLRKELKDALEAENIFTPYPKTEILKDN